MLLLEVKDVLCSLQCFWQRCGWLQSQLEHLRVAWHNAESFAIYANQRNQWNLQSFLALWRLRCYLKPQQSRVLCWQVTFHLPTQTYCIIKLIQGALSEYEKGLELCLVGWVHGWVHFYVSFWCGTCIWWFRKHVVIIFSFLSFIF